MEMDRGQEITTLVTIEDSGNVSQPILSSPDVSDQLVICEPAEIDSDDEGEIRPTRDNVDPRRSLGCVTNPSFVGKSYSSR